VKTAIARSLPGPRLVGAAALLVLGACGVALLVSPAHSASLASRSHWVLATALPTSGDFPADWGYQLSGWFPRAQTSATTESSTPPPTGPRAVYAPAACSTIPKLLSRSGAALAAKAGVDRYTESFIYSAQLWDAPATGESDRLGPNAELFIWVVPDGPAQIANYLDWLHHCGSYQVTNYGFGGRFKNRRTVTTAVESRSPDRTAAGGAVAVAVARTFTTTAGDSEAPATYHVSYSAVRGVILECTIYNFDGADRDLVKQRAAATLARLRTL
jgi:hypothetical protein